VGSLGRSQLQENRFPLIVDSDDFSVVGAAFCSALGVRPWFVRDAQRYFEMALCDKESAQPNSRAESSLDWNWMICRSLGVRSRGLDIGGEILA
jgi:hypothetical protein